MNVITLGSFRFILGHLPTFLHGEPKRVGGFLICDCRFAIWLVHSTGE
jgi:hypothetical protein